jgi:competence protein ComEA
MDERRFVMTKSIRRFLALGLVLALGLAFSGAAFAAESAPAAKVNINTATAEQLEALPGVGAKLAARIVEYRQKSGSFKTTQELMNVQGVGEKSFAKLQPHLTVGEAPRSGGSR